MSRFDRGSHCRVDTGVSWQVKDAVPGLYPGSVGAAASAAGGGEFAYSRVPELSQAASAKARQRQRREKHAGHSQGGEWAAAVNATQGLHNICSAALVRS